MSSTCAVSAKAAASPVELFGEGGARAVAAWIPMVGGDSSEISHKLFLSLREPQTPFSISPFQKHLWNPLDTFAVFKRGYARITCCVHCKGHMELQPLGWGWSTNSMKLLHSDEHATWQIMAVSARPSLPWKVTPTVRSHSGFGTLSVGIIVAKQVNPAQNRRD